MIRAAAWAAIVLLGSGALDAVPAWNSEEHERVARQAFAHVRGEITGFPALDSTLAVLSARSSADALTAARHHRRGRTPLAQLERVSAETLRGARRSARPAGAEPEFRDLGGNVVANYLVQHLMALEIASRAEVPFAHALAREAVALGCLADAFAAGHLVAPAHRLLARFQRANLARAHRVMRDDGLYVIDGRHDVWQTFGDGLLEWFGPVHRHVLDAAVESVREVALVRVTAGTELQPQESFRAWADSVAGSAAWEETVRSWMADEPGRHFYETARLPALLRIPMPVTATWNVSGRHAPQRPDLHDPADRALDPEFLYAREALPPWMRVALSGSPAEAIHSDPDVASVRFIQRTKSAPALAGVVSTAGAAVSVDGRTGDFRSVGIGVVAERTAPVVETLHAGIHIEWFETFGRPGRHAVASSLSGGFGLPVTGLSGVQLEAGYVNQLDDRIVSEGFLSAFRIASAPVDLPLGYWGASLEAAYRRIGLENPINTIEIRVRIQ